MTLDRRLNAFREDLADARRAGHVDAPRYAAGRPARIGAPVAPCLRRPEAHAPLDTEYLYGEPVDVFDEADGYAWVQSRDDGYVGYVASAAIAPEGPPPTHSVSVPMALVYAGPSIKVPVQQRLPHHALLALGPEAHVGGERFHTVHGGGHILAQHVAPLGSRETDFVSVAQRYLGTPYLYGGKSWFGIDCSALVQQALKAVGVAAPRDSDMQAAALGERLPDGSDNLARGDLI
ncbi:MAG: NlpC/P60 family protein, partial [Pseudomonadota bacterium]